MQRLSINWEGDLIPSPHGDLVNFRDVERLMEELESLRNQEPKPERVFGWVSPSDARKFMSGQRESIRVFKMQTPLFRMPLRCDKGPNHYQKPPLGALVTVLGNRQAKVLEHVEQGLSVELDGVPGIVNKWSYKT